MDECPICLETCHEDFQSSCCKKNFHKNCYEKCLNINNTCPTCRTVFIKVEHEVEIKINCCTWRIICFCCMTFVGMLIPLGIAGVMAFGILYKGDWGGNGTMGNGTIGN